METWYRLDVDHRPDPDADGAVRMRNISHETWGAFDLPEDPQTPTEVVNAYYESEKARGPFDTVTLIRQQADADAQGKRLIFDRIIMAARRPVDVVVRTFNIGTRGSALHGTLAPRVILDFCKFVDGTARIRIDNEWAGLILRVDPPVGAFAYTEWSVSGIGEKHAYLNDIRRAYSGVNPKQGQDEIEEAVIRAVGEAHGINMEPEAA